MVTYVLDPDHHGSGNRVDPDAAPKWNKPSNFRFFSAHLVKPERLIHDSARLAVPVL